MKITHEKEKCIGCGACVAVCPKFWEMGEDGKSHLIGSKVNKDTNNEELEIPDAGCCQQAAEGCPVNIIQIK